MIIEPLFPIPTGVQIPSLPSTARNIRSETQPPVTSLRAGVQFNADGFIYFSTGGTGFASTGKKWLLSGSAGDYYIRRTVNSGFPNTTLEVDGGSEVLLSTSRTYRIQVQTQGVTYNANISFFIGLDAPVTTPLASGIYSISARIEDR